MGRVLPFVIYLVLLIYALTDLFQAEADRVRVMPRWLWVVTIVVVPYLGALGYLFFGRPEQSSGKQNGPPSRPRAPDDDADFLRGL